MAKIAEKSAQVKGRQTKLSKKSSEELIEIILRKDKVERNLSENIKKIKAEINDTVDTLIAAKKDCDTLKEKYTEIKDNLNTYIENNDRLRTNISDLETAIAKKEFIISELKKENKAYTQLTFCTAIIALVILLGWIIC